MSDIIDDFNKILRKDLAPLLLKYFKDSNKKIPDNIDTFIDDPQAFLKDIFAKFSKNKDYDKEDASYTNTENLIDIDVTDDDEYDDLFKKLILIEENMIQIEKFLKDKN